MLDVQRARELIEAFDGRRVAVVGDVYLDEYVHCRPLGISPEMPVLRAVEERGDRALGAAGNTAANLRALGAEVLLAAVVGDDDAAGRIFGMAEGAGIDCSALVRDPARRTGVFSRIVLHGATGTGHHQIRVDREITAPPVRAACDALRDAIEAWLPEQAAIVVADYDETRGRHGLFGRPLFDELRSLAGRRHALVVATSRRHPDALRGAAHLFVNRAEAERLGLRAEDDPQAFAARLREQGGHDVVTLTLGSEGVVVSGPDGTYALGTIPGRVVDPCGAGDALLSATALARLAGGTLREASELGIHAAALAVSHAGTRAISGAELAAQVRFRGAGGGKLHDPGSLAGILDGLRESRKIVFANGFFDLFHSGHVELLRQARKLGDLLVVALNSDRSTRENKGEGRPVLDERERVDILASLEFVDFVTVFDELTPINVIRHVRPHLIVKGGNYRPEEVVGKDLVESYGGRVVVIPYAGRTTTEKLIRSIRDASDGTRPG